MENQLELIKELAAVLKAHKYELEGINISASYIHINAIDSEYRCTMQNPPLGRTI